MSADRWERFYEERDYDRCIYLEGEEMVEYAERFFERVGVPHTFASVGCGPAATEFELAERYPDTEFYCYDVARTVIEDNRELARERGLDNLAFAVAALPELDLDRTFDLVYCVATLYFVERVEDALRSLWEHVAPGGHLVVSYPDDDLREWVRDQDDRKREFFSLVEAGTNVVTEADVERVLGTDVRSYWAAVDADGGRSATVCVQR